jgi:hypothetical protein
VAGSTQFDKEVCQYSFEIGGYEADDLKILYLIINIVTFPISG